VFETLFKYPRVVARHRTGPAAEARERFLKHCVGQGLAGATLLRHARELLVIAERIDITRGEPIGWPAIEAAADCWAREQRDRHRVQALQGSRKLFVQTATTWLQFLGCLEEPQPKTVPFADRLADFAAYQREERGLSPATIRGQGWQVEKFLSWLGEQNRPFDEVSLEEVDTFLANNGKRGWGRISVSTSAKALRAFFRHAAVRGWCGASIASGIDGPRLFRHEGLPVGPPWMDVQRLIASAGGDSARDIRDRAILMLLATYGFRSGEVAGLCLEDLNWESEIIAISRPKPRRAQEYPLVSQVGEAILRYLQQVRPRCARREIFLSLKAPFRRLSQGALYHLVSTRLGTLGIRIPRRGPHSLRHACAGRLVAEGFSLKEIGDHLGHRSAEATRIYAKVDLVGLREVANFDLGGLR
jgi:integrase/recombinase XerD